MPKENRNYLSAISPISRINMLTFAMAFIGLTLSVYHYITRPRIAFVRSQELVYGYTGMQEMHNKYETQTKIWQSNVDTLKKEYQQAVEKYQDEESGLSSQEKTKRQQRLAQKQEEVASYANKVNEEAKKQEDEMLQGVLNQINTLVIDYGKSKGYDIIIGTTADGNLLYGKDALDVTDVLLKELNKNYKK